LGTLTNAMSTLLWIAFHLANRSHCAKLGSGVPGTATLAGQCGIGTAQLLSVTMTKTSLKSPLRYPGNR